MGRIHLLPDQLINRIAAGEVVERPASVLKELVENALDAGARTIDVRLLGGGKRLIRVSDDGEGMDRDDALLALERHATSKLTGPEDLDSIATLGFRGEALASIAAVSRLVLRTATSDGAGTEVEIKAGKIIAVREAGLPRGTTLEVERLFFNVPARQKFLRADATELSQATRLMTQCALAYPRIRFRLDHGERRLLNADPAPGLDERIAQIYGRSFLEKLLPFNASAGGVRVEGFAGRPAEALTRRDGQHFFVNGRVVQDRVLSHALMQAYDNTMPKGRFPAIILFVTIDPELVDVNVHPRKSEVRFRASGVVHDLVRQTLAGALSQHGAVPELADLRPQAGGADLGGVRRAALSYLEVAEAGGWRPPGKAPPRELVDAMETESSGPRSPLTPLAQYRDAYIVAQDEEGLVLVDQHAAHERILFEKYLRHAVENRVEIQKLLFPVTIELAPAELLIVEQETDAFRRLGFLVEPFGGNTVRLDAIPAIAEGSEPEPLLRELLGEAGRARSAAADIESFRLRLVTTAACKAAVKVNDPLNRESMQRLLDDLFATDNPTTCPHGRPLLFRLPLAEIERAFGRR